MQANSPLPRRPGHTTPQAPQFLGSVLRSTSQGKRESGHVAVLSVHVVLAQYVIDSASTSAEASTPEKFGASTGPAGGGSNSIVLWEQEKTMASAAAQKAEATRRFVIS